MCYILLSFTILNVNCLYRKVWKEYKNFEQWEKMLLFHVASLNGDLMWSLSKGIVLFAMCNQTESQFRKNLINFDQAFVFFIDTLDVIKWYPRCAFVLKRSRPGSKLTMSLINVSLKFQMLISEICQYLLLKKYEKLSQCKSFSHFFNKKLSVYLIIKLWNT